MSKPAGVGSLESDLFKGKPQSIMRKRGGKIFRGQSVRTNSRWHMMLGGISKQQVRVPWSRSHGPVKGVNNKHRCIYALVW